MLLRSLTKHVKGQNWFAVALDFFIVVVGILIAFQITNWSEGQRESALERQYLERLRDDMAISAKQGQESLSAVEGKIADQAILLNALETCTLNDQTRQDVVDAIVRTGQFEPPSLVRGVIDELQSTGRINIISNIDLRRELTDVIDEQRKRTDVLGYIVERASAQIAYIDARRVFMLPEGEKYTADLNPEWVSFDFPALCEDPLYAGAVSSVHFFTSVTANHLADMNTLIEALLSSLEKELGITAETDEEIK